MSIKDDMKKMFNVTEEEIDRIVEYKKKEELKRKIRDALLDNISEEDIKEWKEKGDRKVKNIVREIERIVGER